MTQELINAQQDERGRVLSALNELIEAGQTRELSAEENEKMKSLFEEGEQLKTKFDAEKQKLDNKHRLEVLQAELYSAGGQRKPHLILGHGTATGGKNSDNFASDADKEKEKQARQKLGMSLYFAGQISTAEAEKYDLRADVNTAGGLLYAPQVMIQELFMDLRDKTFIRKIADVMQPLPKKGSLGQITGTKVGRPTRTGEKQRATADSSLSFGKREMFTHDQSLSIPVSRELLKHADRDIESMIRLLFSEAFADEQEYEYFLGDGVKKPLGVFVAHADGIPTSRDYSTGHTSSTVVHPDNLLGLAEQVHESHQAKGSYIMNRQVKLAFRLSKASTAGTYLWQPSLIAGQPDTFNGYPVYTSEKAPSTMTSGSYVAVFGDFKEYKILDAAEMDWFVNPYRKGDTKEVEFDCTVYNDGQPRRQSAFSRSKMP